MQENELPQTQVNQSVSNSIPANDQQPKTNSFLVILLSVLLFVAVAIAGFFAFQTQKLVKEITVLKNEGNSVAVPSTEPVATESSEVDPTANWKTYTSNEQLDIPESYFEKFRNLKNDLPKSFIFRYPDTWKIIKIEPSEYQKTVNLGYYLYKSDPNVNCGNGGGGGPCDNSAKILFRFGMVDSTIKNFDQTFWGDGFPIDHETNIVLNDTNVVQAYPAKLSQYPEVSLFKIAPSGQFHVRSDFFAKDATKTTYSEDTIKEINLILSTFKFLD
jgi:hypothetical protein